MKKALILFFLLFSVKCYSQVYLKGSALFFPMDGGAFYSGSAAMEFRYKHCGIEYMRNVQGYGGGISYKSNTQQVALKSYFSFLDNKRLKNVYISPFYRIKKMTATEDIELPGYAATQSAKGFGYGIMLGKNFDLSDYSVEAALYYYTLKSDVGNRFDNVASASVAYGSLGSYSTFGLRLYIYLKFDVLKNKPVDEKH